MKTEAATLPTWLKEAQERVEMILRSDVLPRVPNATFEWLDFENADDQYFAELDGHLSVEYEKITVSLASPPYGYEGLGAEIYFELPLPQETQQDPTANELLQAISLFGGHGVEAVLGESSIRLLAMRTFAAQLTAEEVRWTINTLTNRALMFAEFFSGRTGRQHSKKPSRKRTTPIMNHMLRVASTTARSPFA